jgi:hypothetical protein
MLKLQLRSAEREAADAEAALSANQLEPKLAARSEAMDLELENEQTKAAAVTAKARRAADVMVTQATMEMRRAQPEPEPVVDVVPEPEPVVDVVPEPEPEPVVDVVPEALVELVPDEVPAAAAPVDEPAVVMPPVERDRNDALPSPYGVSAAPSSLATEGSVFILDAQGLAHVLARVIVGILDEREATRPPAPQPQPQQWVYPPMMMMPQQQVAPVPEKKPGWKSAMHLDVVLLGISTVIVLVVLAAWLG